MKLYNTLSKSYKSRNVPDDPYRLMMFACFQVALQEFVDKDIARSVDALVWLVNPETLIIMTTLGYHVDVIDWITQPGLDRRGLVKNARIDLQYANTEKI